MVTSIGLKQAPIYAGFGFYAKYGNIRFITYVRHYKLNCQTDTLERTIA